jgi:hypothetical protein
MRSWLESWIQSQPMEVEPTPLIKYRGRLYSITAHLKKIAHTEFVGLEAPPAIVAVGGFGGGSVALGPFIHRIFAKVKSKGTENFWDSRGIQNAFIVEVTESSEMDKFLTNAKIRPLDASV